MNAERTVDAIPPEKRAYYDAVQQAYDEIYHYQADAPMPGNGLSIGCRHGKCGVILPSGLLTEEANISRPASPPRR